MKKMPMFAFGLACFVFGAIVQTGLAQKRGAFNAADVFQGKEPRRPSPSSPTTTRG